MIITIGAFQTRDGCKAEVVDVRAHVAIGWIGCLSYNWRVKCGTCIGSGTTQSDLVAAWCDDHKFRPWTEDEVPLGAHMRGINTRARWLLDRSGRQEDRVSWLANCEHSIDLGRTWKPCGAEVKP